MPNGRPISPRERDLVVKSFTESNLTQAKFCSQFGVAATTLQNALKRSRMTAGPKQEFFPVIVAPKNLGKESDASSVITIKSQMNFVIEFAKGTDPFFVAKILRGILCGH
jgi:hypothetical protein